MLPCTKREHRSTLTSAPPGSTIDRIAANPSLGLCVIGHREGLRLYAVGHTRMPARSVKATAEKTLVVTGFDGRGSTRRPWRAAHSMSARVLPKFVKTSAPVTLTAAVNKNAAEVPVASTSQPVMLTATIPGMVAIVLLNAATIAACRGARSRILGANPDQVNARAPAAPHKRPTAAEGAGGRAQST
jgi:hypothetical protein